MRIYYCNYANLMQMTLGVSHYIHMYILWFVISNWTTKYMIRINLDIEISIVMVVAFT